ncbi:DUF4870 domain-containing protein [Salegentibacter sp. F188]|uniref:DUF4870 domain-containing protein n=1 Tax=Autumnicola patrickiae TaxID=3075591 RepID=A0ABU3DZ90_9FLAO|nr:DUF4870 domain-containing protein [Salegentibacter sp. F188]MDT0689041.1 DUF4870 domain-containing protein [Salegentibacter sp. F188]
MNSSIDNRDKNLATLIHLSVFTKFLFPLGNFLFPLLFWIFRKDDEFVDHHGKNALNFQISIFLYSILIALLGLAGIVFTAINLDLQISLHTFPEFAIDDLQEALSVIILVGVFGTLLLALFILEIFAVISASLKANEGESYNYPLCINFIPINYTNHQSKNGQFNNKENHSL